MLFVWSKRQNFLLPPEQNLHTLCSINRSEDYVGFTKEIFRTFVFLIQISNFNTFRDKYTVEKSKVFPKKYSKFKLFEQK